MNNNIKEYFYGQHGQPYQLSSLGYRAIDANRVPEAFRPRPNNPPQPFNNPLPIVNNPPPQNNPININPPINPAANINQNLNANNPQAQIRLNYLSAPYGNKISNQAAVSFLTINFPYNRNYDDYNIIMLTRGDGGRIYITKRSEINNATRYIDENGFHILIPSLRNTLSLGTSQNPHIRINGRNVILLSPK